VIRTAVSYQLSVVSKTENPTSVYPPAVVQAPIVVHDSLATGSWQLATVFINFASASPGTVVSYQLSVISKTANPTSVYPPTVVQAPIVVHDSLATGSWQLATVFINFASASPGCSAFINHSPIRNAS